MQSLASSTGYPIPEFSVDDNSPSIDPVISSSQPQCVWGSKWTTAYDTSTNQTNQILYTSRQLIQRISDHGFLHICGSRVAVYDSKIASSPSTLASTILLPTLPAVRQYLSLHLSYPSERYLACPVRLRAHEELNVAAIALFDFPSMTKYSSSSYASVIPKLLRYKKKIQNNQVSNERSVNDLGSEEPYEFISVSFFNDSSQFAAITNVQEDGILIFTTISVLLNSSSLSVTPLKTLPPQLTVVSSFSFHPTDQNKYVVCGTNGYFTFWRYTGNALRSAPLTGLTSYSVSDESFSCYEWVVDNIAVAGTIRGDIILIQGCEVIFVSKNVFQFQQNDNSNNRLDDSSSASSNSNAVSKILVRDNIIAACCYSRGIVVVFEMTKFLSSTRQDLSAKVHVVGRYQLLNTISNDLNVSNDIDSKSQTKTSNICTSIDWSTNSDQSCDIVVLSDKMICIYELKATAANQTNNKSVERTSSSQSLSSASTGNSTVISTSSSIVGNHIVRPKKVLFSFQSGGINSLAVSSRGSYFLSSSTVGRSVHIRNYLGYDESTERDMLTSNPNHLTTDNILDPTSTPLCCAFHPSGLYVAIGGEDELVEYAVADKRLKALRRINLKAPFYLTSNNNSDALEGSSTVATASCVSVQPPSMVRYSRGGHLLGVATGKVLRVYHMQKLDYLNAEKIGIPSLIFATNEHSANLTDFYFTYDDGDIVSSSSDGYIYSWRIVDSIKENDYCMKGYHAKVVAVGCPLFTNNMGKLLMNKEMEDNKTLTGTIIASFHSNLGGDSVMINNGATNSSRNTGKGTSTARIRHTLEDDKPNYVAVWRQENKQNHHHTNKRKSRIINSGTALIAQNESSNSGLNPFPDVFIVESSVTSAALSWISDGLNKIEICVLGCEDGRVIISILPLPHKIISTAAHKVPHSITYAVNSRVVTGNLTSSNTLRNENKTTKSQQTKPLTVSGNQKNGKTGLNATKDELIPVMDMFAYDDQSLESSSLNSARPNTGSKSYYVLNESCCKVHHLHYYTVSGCAISPSGSYIFTSGNDGCVYMLILQPLYVQTSTPLNNNHVRSVISQQSSKHSGKSTINNGYQFPLVSGLMSLPEGNKNDDNELLLTDRNVYLHMKSRLDIIDANMEGLKNEHNLQITALKEELAEQRLLYEQKLKNESSKYDANTLKYKQDYITLQKQMKIELNEKDSTYQQKIEELEIEYEKRLIKQNEHLQTMKQAYDEHVVNMKFDLFEREKAKDVIIGEIQGEKEKYESEVSQQKKAIELYVNFMNNRNQEIIGSLEDKQTQERIKLKQDLEEVKQELESQQKKSKNDIMYYQTQLQKLKIDMTAKDDQITKLHSELEWNKGRIESMESDIKLLNKDVESSTARADRWEERSKEQQNQINELEKARKSLTVQLHHLREEMNPQEIKLQKFTDRMSEMEGEYMTLLHKTGEKDSHLSQYQENIRFLQKELRDIRKQSSQKDLLLKRLSKLYYDYKTLLYEGEGHKALLKLAARISNTNNLSSSSIHGLSNDKVKDQLEKDFIVRNIINQARGNKKDGSTPATAFTGRILEEMDLTLSRMDDLLDQYSQKKIEEIDLQDDEATKTKEERERHIHHLHASINGLKTNLTHSKTTSKAELSRRIQDNQSLLVEVNELRQEIRDMAQDNQRLQATIEFTERRYRKISEEYLKLKSSIGNVGSNENITSDQHILYSPANSITALSDYISIVTPGNRIDDSPSLGRLTIQGSSSPVLNRQSKVLPKKRITDSTSSIHDEASEMVSRRQSALSAAGASVFRNQDSMIIKGSKVSNEK